MTSTVVLAVLWGVSELLAEIPQVKSNSVFQLVRAALGVVLGKK